MPEIRKNDVQIYRKSFENQPLGPPWGLCGATLEALGKDSIEGPQGGTPPPPNFGKAIGVHMHQSYAQMDALTGGDQGWNS